MAQKTFVSNTAYDVNGGRCLVDGTGYSIQKGRTLVDGTGYDVAFENGVELSTFSEGSLVKLNESGSPVEFYVAKHNYESELNGSGRTLLVRKDCYDMRKFNSSTTLDSYYDSDIQEWLESTYKSLLDANARTAIGSTKIYYVYSSESTSASSGKAFSVFLLSTKELGRTASYTVALGTQLPIANTLRKARTNGVYHSQWTRNLVKASEDDESVCVLDETGSIDYMRKTSSSPGSRPAFTLPSTALFDPETFEFVG